MHPRALVIGRTGQLARELARTSAAFDPVFVGREDAVTRPDEAAALVERSRPAHVGEAVECALDEVLGPRGREVA